MAGISCRGFLQAGSLAAYLHDGDRVTFYGDSITAQRLYPKDIESFVDTRYPKLNIVFHNAGVPGDRVTGGYAGDAATRVTRNVTPFNPPVITVKLLREAAPDARTTLLEQAEFSLRVETSAGGKKSANDAVYN